MSSWLRCPRVSRAVREERPSLQLLLGDPAWGTPGPVWGSPVQDRQAGVTKTERRTQQKVALPSEQDLIATDSCTRGGCRTMPDSSQGSTATGREAEGASLDVPTGCEGFPYAPPALPSRTREAAPSPSPDLLSRTRLGAPCPSCPRVGGETQTSAGPFPPDRAAALPLPSAPPRGSRWSPRLSSAVPMPGPPPAACRDRSPPPASRHLRGEQKEE